MEQRAGFTVGIAAGILGILGILAVPSCAFGDRHVTLSYPPPPVRQTAATRPRPQLAAAPAPMVALQNFSDTRTKEPIGEVRNGFGMHTADVVAEGSVSEWVTSAVAHELQQAGLRVYRLNGQRPPPGATVVSGQIVHFYCRAMLSYEAEVSFIGQLATNNEIFSGHQTGAGGSGVNWAATEDGYGESLAIALQDAARRFVLRIYPIVTRPPPPPPAPPPPPPAAPTQPTPPASQT